MFGISKSVTFYQSNPQRTKISMNTEEKTVKAKVLISGRVQGVFFRGSTRSMATSLGLGGYVRNLSDGRVEAVFEGPARAVRKAVSWCRKGPPSARVESVDVNWLEPSGEYASFGVRRTAEIN